MTEPSEADRQAAREWLLPEIDFDAAVYEGAVQSLASVIAKHHAAERERARKMEEALLQIRKYTDRAAPCLELTTIEEMVDSALRREPKP